MLKRADPPAWSPTDRPDVSEGLDAEVLVSGAGIVGLVLAIGLARLGIEVILAGRMDTRAPGRTVALLNGSIAVLDDIGLWQELEPLSEPLRVMRIVDDRGSLFAAPPVSFRAEEVGQPWFGRNIRNADLLETLAGVARAQPRLVCLDRPIAGYEFGPARVVARCEAGDEVRVSVALAADGRRSAAREAAGVKAKTWRYPQTALTTILHHERPHHGVSTEFHTRQGPFTLVPLPPSVEAPHRSSLVWVMEPERAETLRTAPNHALAEAIARQSRRLLGGVSVEGPTGSFPITGLIADRMAAPRLALAGEAAHVFPPIGAQGLNLGLRDVAALLDLLGAEKRRDGDLGSPALLHLYAAGRRGDVALRTMGVDQFNRSLLSAFPPNEVLRGLGLVALARIGPLRRMAMKVGLGSGL